MVKLHFKCNLSVVLKVNEFYVMQLRGDEMRGEERRGEEREEEEKKREMGIGE